MKPADALRIVLHKAVHDLVESVEATEQVDPAHIKQTQLVVDLLDKLPPEVRDSELPEDTEAMIERIKNLHRESIS